MRLALNETIGVLGLVLAVLFQSFAPVLPFALGAIVLNLLAYPRIEPLLERAARLGI